MEILGRDPSSIATAAAPACAHCGSRIPAGTHSRFCCKGCETVYSLLQERGLGAYYGLRDRFSDQRRLGPVETPSDSFSYLDDPDFQKSFSEADSSQMRFYLEGAHCAACVWLTEKLPQFSNGVEAARLDLSSHVATVRIKPGGSFSEAARTIAKLGYRPHPVKHEETRALRDLEARRHLLQMGVAGACAGNIMLLAVSLYAGADGALGRTFEWVSFALYLPVLFYSAQPFYQNAWAAVRSKRISIDVPIVLGTLFGTLVSVANLIRGSDKIYFDSLSSLVFLMLAGRYLLRKVQARAFDSSQLAQFLAPSISHLKRADSDECLDARTDSLRAGDLIRVYPGENFPVDGVVESGRSSVSCALLTGEFAPVTVIPGASVFAGSVNQSSVLDVRVTVSGSSSRLGQILRAAEEGLRRKAPIVELTDRVGQAFVAATLGLVVLGFFIGLRTGVDEAVSRALAVAIIVCPCVFAFATPLAMSLAMGKLARAGILSKGADVIERLSQVRTVFLDKTGTLTEGSLKVVDWSGSSPDLEPILLALEAGSNHPVAQAIRRFFGSTPRALPQVENFVETPGRGVAGDISGDRYELVKATGSTPRGFASDGLFGTTVELFKNGAPVAWIRFGDSIRRDAKNGLGWLRSLGLELRILSGDRADVVGNIGSALGFKNTEMHSGVSPEEKGSIVRTAERSLMVGDGANDAVALASAHVGMAVQGGMEVSLQAADIYCGLPGLTPIAQTIIVARETMKVIRRNLVFTVFFNLIGISAALAGKLNPLFAAILMPVSAITVFGFTMLGTRALRSALREGLK